MPLSSVLGAQSLVKPGVCTSSTRPASPYDGQVIYESDTDTVRVWDGSVWDVVGTGVFTSTTRPSSPYEGKLIYETDTNLVKMYDGASWVTVGPTTPLTVTSATVATSQSTSSATYTDLATVGPQVTLTTGTQALVIISAGINIPSYDWVSSMSIAVSGATTIAASDSRMLSQNAHNQTRAASRVVLFDSLTAGSNTFTAKYKAGGGTSATFSDRSLMVIPL